MRLLRLMSCLSLIALAAGCAPLDEDNFGERYATTVCSRSRGCDRSDFEDNFEDFEACTQPVTDFWDSAIAGASVIGLEFDPDGAAECLREIRTASCDRFTDGDFDGQCDVNDLFD